MFTFQQADPAILYDLMTVPMLPQHVWAHLEKPGEFTNPNPVGTGPFTQVTLFETRQNGTERTVQFERNPYYWQADQIAIQGVRYTIRHEEHAIVDLQQNRLDWALLDLPDPQKDFVDLSPQFFHIAAAWGSTNFLELNTSRPPFDIPTVRKAISMAIDREKLLANFSPQALPANAIGLTTRERYWWNQQAIADGYWLEYNLDMANAMLDEIGFYRGPDGTRVSPSGVPLRFEYLLNDDAFDWNGIPTDAIMRLIADDLAAVGIEVVLSEVADDRYWDEMSKGKFDMVIVESGGLWLYHSTLLPDDYGLCCGSKTNAEAGRYFSAAAPALFQAFDAETDPARQRDIIGQLQTIFVEDAPVLPLYASQHYYQYNTSRFTGFPTETNPYASGSPMAMDALLVFLHLKPAR
jgi:peptide/nickel transport system substrate-binding protein